MLSSSVKSKRSLIEGRSFPLNSLFVAAHVVILFFALNSFFGNSTGSSLEKIIFCGVLILLTLGLFILKGFYMYSYVARFFLGLVLLIAGFGKINDPIGFAEILKLYFQDGSLNLWLSEWFGWQAFSLQKHADSALTYAVILAILEILLAVMLMFHQLYKLAVWLTFVLFGLFFIVNSFNFSCNPDKTFEQEVVINKNDDLAQGYRLRSVSDDSFKLINETEDQLLFSETKHLACLTDCGCLGADQSSFIGLNYTKNLAFVFVIMLFAFSIVLMSTQFVLHPNSAGENTVIGFSAWIVVLVHGIFTSWFWLVFLSAIILYLSLNIKRFAKLFKQWTILTLVILGFLLYGLSYYVINYEPLSDFRPYALGNTITASNVEDSTGIKKIFVYKDKRTDKELFLNEESYASSMIFEDTNFVFVRMHNFDLSAFSNIEKSGFNPLLNVQHIVGSTEHNSFIQPAYEAYFEDMVEVRNGITREVVIYKKSDFPIDLEKDTNLIIKSFSGVNKDIEFISVQELILEHELVFIWVVKDLPSMSQGQLEKMKELNKQLFEEEQSVVVLGDSDNTSWEKQSAYPFHELPYLMMNRAELMKICRSNVCLMILKKGRVVGKYPVAGIPKYETIISKIQ